MRRLLGDEWDAFCEAFTSPLAVRGIRVNRLKCSVEQVTTLLPFALTPTPFCDDGLATAAAFRAGSDPLHHAGAYYVQEPSAMSAVTVLAPCRGERVLDVCAAPGGKSTQIAATLQGEGLLWCNEYVPSRARILAQNLERCGVRNAVVSAGDTAQLIHLRDGFDAVLADVPCSGEGMFRKEPEALEQWSEDNIRLCAARGQEILNNAASCVRPGGRLVLSTCTFAPEENEWAVVRFLRTHPDFELIDSGVTFGREGFDADRIASFGEAEERSFAHTVPLAYCRRILPQDGGEGHFMARFVRKGDACATIKPYCFPKTDEAVRLAAELYAECFTDAPSGSFVRFGDTVRLLPTGMPDTQGVSVLCAGVAAAQLRTGRVLRVEPSHALFQSAKAAQCRRLLSLPPDDSRLTAFLHGEELAVDLPNGYTAVAVDKMVTGFGKVSSGRLKNHYPKGLRLL